MKNKDKQITQNNVGGIAMSNQSRWVPGEVVPESGNYTAYDSRGNNGGSCYLERGKRFPATQHSGSYYELDN